MRIWKAKTSNFQGNLLLTLFWNRGLESEAEISRFLDPKFEETYDPFLLKDMDAAVKRIEDALGNQERITIYADYDADAVTAAAVLLRFFEHLGHKNLDYYIPDRFTEGYGVNPEAIKSLANAGTNLIITVDCGINAFDSVDLATYLGLDVIITDHHQLTPHHSAKGEGGIPRALAVINPHRSDDIYPFKDLTGVGVAFKLVQALVISLSSSPDEGRMPRPPWRTGQEGSNASINPSPTLPSTGEKIMKIVKTTSLPFGHLPSLGEKIMKITKGWEKWLLDLVAIGTVADCQSLLGENRIFVKWGLYVLQKTRWIGLKKLLELAGVWQIPLDTYKIGFIIAPRINAAGRIEHANLALELLLTDDPAQAQYLAQKLEELNRHRQQLTQQILSEAREQILNAGRDKKILLAASSGWPKGIVGLVAGKLTEEFYRPVLILEKGDEEATGSARSIAKFNMVKALSQSREILVKYGGHPMAAGFTLRNEHIDIFHQNLLQYAEEVLTQEDMSPVLYYDGEIALDQINPELVEGLEKFAPFGLGNPRPRFRINELKLRFAQTVGTDNQHLRVRLEGQGAVFSGIAFNQGYHLPKLQDSENLDIVCEIQYNNWRGGKEIQLKIVDIKVSERG